MSTHRSQFSYLVSDAIRSFKRLIKYMDMLVTLFQILSLLGVAITWEGALRCFL